MSDVLRRARVEDLPLMWRGEAAYMKQIEPGHEAGWVAAADRNLAGWIAGLERTLILEADGEPAGYAAWAVTDGRAVLTTIHVFAAFRRGGRGGALLQAYVNDAHTFGHKALALAVLRGNPAETLYVRYGFEHTHDDGRYKHYALTLT
ncbi:GNAT family N-acetyltransferase [Paractinoplanes hotanensis]|uniref:GNAT family N-acetyltransferase n=1 Tax=Paractinoplanes hotanensis TaxID=2906497 RepID=A0ABT0Y5J7_9ACTN|nr:GNAT family N-acetyltransferase [Actinoplanes hotanensis]MCM4081135.1 GNAT family N-acetyltransferase [Actinoplanes hotanensis]